MTNLETQSKPWIDRALQNLPLAYQALIRQRYQRIQPILHLLLNSRDILERNRTWPGITPKGKQATRYLTLAWSRQARKTIKDYAVQYSEDNDELWQLCRAYFRYGPIGLVDALDSQLPPLIPDELQECADFHRLAKHPRSDAGVYIRELLNMYADDLGYKRLPQFVARYAWATDRKLERWYFGEGDSTEHVAKTTRRLNVDDPYPHQRWHVRMAPLPLPCVLAHRHPISVFPWIIWLTDEHTSTHMGFRICPAQPTAQDVWLTFRWAIWHYDAPWWKARGVPDELVVPAELATINTDTQRALAYMRTRIHSAKAVDLISTSLPSDGTTGLPQSVINWLNYQSKKLVTTQGRSIPISELQATLLELIQEAQQDGTIARSTPTALAEQGCSLPWSRGIAAALLLPSAGTHGVEQEQVSPWGIPFDLSESGLPDGKEVEIRYNPDDARAIYVIHDGAKVVLARAQAFEHRTMWTELVETPNLLG